MSEPLWSDERIADAATTAWHCYDFRLGARIEMKKMRNEYEERIAELEAQLAAIPVDAILSVVVRYGFAVERGQDKQLDAVNDWLDIVRPMEGE